jgi:septal ring factor EnvC (AmiA/AmiB activator)
VAETLREIQAVREPSSAGDADLAPPPRRPRRWHRVLLVLVLLAGGFWIAHQAQQNRALEARVEQLGAKLESAQAELQAYRDRLSDVRTRVGDLRLRIGELEELVQLPPDAPVEPRAAE